MGIDYFPKRDHEFLAWLKNFTTVANSYGATLGLTLTQLSELTTARTNYENALDDLETIRGTARSYVQNKKQVKAETQSLVRELVRIIQANPDVTNNQRQELGITVRDTEPTPILPQQPTNLTVSGNENGVNTLRWQTGGNPYGTQYLVEIWNSAANRWDQVDVTTRSNYRHTNQVPGLQQFYRVKAKRTQYLSPPSNVAVVYGDPAAAAFLEAA